ncbi:MAG: sulfate/molybdate ABC transporter ATP-binding protein [Hylemonella sp.]
MGLKVRLRNPGPIALEAEFECAAGELIALVGPSGSGKTSLLRAVAGLLHAPRLSGLVQVGDEPWFDSSRGLALRAQQRRVGLVFQHYALFPHLTALQNVAIAGPTPVKLLHDQGLHALFERLGLSGLAQRRPAQLSGGQQQRVALARALRRITPATDSGKPQQGVLLLDEPFSAVDAPTRQTLYRELAALRQEMSTPMVLVTHDLAEARRLADRVVIVDGGQTLQSGPPAKVFASPRNARVAQLVGIQNHFAGRFFKQAPGWGRLNWQDSSGAVLQLRVVDKNRLDDGVAVSWVVLGEYVEVHAPDNSATHAGDQDNQVICELQEMLALGETSLCTLSPQALRNTRLTLNLSTAQLRALGAVRGSPLLVRLPAHGIHIMPQRSSS